MHLLLPLLALAVILYLIVASYRPFGIIKKRRYAALTLLLLLAVIVYKIPGRGKAPDGRYLDVHVWRGDPPPPPPPIKLPPVPPPPKVVPYKPKTDRQFEEN